MINIWEDCYLNKKKSHYYSALLRSLQLAFSACKMSLDNLSTIFDSGTKVALWISAFEILFHPERKGIGYKDIISELNKFKLTNSVIKDSLFVINDIETNIVGLIYKEIYDIRNDFFHGNKIDNNGLNIFKKEEMPYATHIAPVIYLIALKVFLTDKKLMKEPITKDFNEHMVRFIMQNQIEEVLTKISQTGFIAKRAKLKGK